MGKTRYGVSVDDEVAGLIDDVVEEMDDDLQADRSEVIDAILTAFFEGTDLPTRKIRELVIKKRRGTL